MARAAALALIATARAQLTSVGSGMSHEVPPLAHVDTHKMIVANTGNDDLGPEPRGSREVFRVYFLGARRGNAERIRAVQLCARRGNAERIRVVRIGSRRPLGFYFLGHNVENDDLNEGTIWDGSETLNAIIAPGEEAGRFVSFGDAFVFRSADMRWRVRTG